MLKKSIVSLFFIIFFLWAAGLFWFVTIIPTEAAQDSVKTDAIVVLTGGSLRLERGFELLTQERAPKMFISGVEDGLTVEALLRNKEYHPFADRIATGSVILGYKARTTIGNAAEIAEWVAHEKVASIRLVTGNYHMPRSIHQIHQAAPQLIIIAEPVFPRYFEDNSWWLHADSIRLVVSEYHKYLISLLIQSAL